MSAPPELEFQDLDEVVLWAKEQIDRVRADADADVIRYRKRAEAAERRWNEELAAASEAARRAAEDDSRAAVRAEMAALEAELCEARAHLNKRSKEESKAQVSDTATREAAVAREAALRREIMAVSDLRVAAERARDEARRQVEALTLEAQAAREAAAAAEAARSAAEHKGGELESRLASESAARQSAEKQLADLQTRVADLTASLATAYSDREAALMGLNAADRARRSAEAAAAAARSESSSLHRAVRDVTERLAEAEVQGVLHAARGTAASPAGPGLLQARGGLAGSAAVASGAGGSLSAGAAGNGGAQAHVFGRPKSFGLRSVLQPSSQSNAAEGGVRSSLREEAGPAPPPAESPAADLPPSRLVPFLEDRLRSLTTSEAGLRVRVRQLEALLATSPAAPHSAASASASALAAGHRSQASSGSGPASGSQSRDPAAELRYSFGSPDGPSSSFGGSSAMSIGHLPPILDRPPLGASLSQPLLNVGAASPAGDDQDPAAGYSYGRSALGGGQAGGGGRSSVLAMGGGGRPGPPPGAPGPAPRFFQSGAPGAAAGAGTGHVGRGAPVSASGVPRDRVAAALRMTSRAPPSNATAAAAYHGSGGGT